MRNAWGLATIAAAVLLMAGCGRSQEDGVGGVTAEEAASLNNAAEMLDTSPDSLAAPADEGDNVVVDADDNGSENGN